MRTLLITILLNYSISIFIWSHTNGCLALSIQVKVAVLHLEDFRSNLDNDPNQHLQYARTIDPAPECACFISLAREMVFQTSWTTLFSRWLQSFDCSWSEIGNGERKSWHDNGAKSLHHLRLNERNTDIKSYLDTLQYTRNIYSISALILDKY